MERETVKTGFGPTFESVNGIAYKRQSPPDQSIEAKVKAIDNRDFVGLMARFTPPWQPQGKAYVLLVRPDGTVDLLLSMLKVLGSTKAAVKSDYKLKLECIGSRIKAYVDGVMFADATDSSYPTGTIGIMCSNAHAEYSNVKGTGVIPDIAIVGAGLGLTVGAVAGYFIKPKKLTPVLVGAVAGASLGAGVGYVVAIKS